MAGENSQLTYIHSYYNLQLNISLILRWLLASGILFSVCMSHEPRTRTNLKMKSGKWKLETDETLLYQKAETPQIREITKAPNTDQEPRLTAKQQKTSQARRARQEGEARERLNFLNNNKLIKVTN